jgi:hypothetical protein
MSTVINPTGGADEPRIGTERTSPQGTRRPDSEPAKRGTDAAEVTISPQAAAVSQTLQLASENVAATGGSVADISRASELVKSLAEQVSAQPRAAHAAHRISPKSTLNLLS